MHSKQYNINQRQDHESHLHTMEVGDARHSGKLFHRGKGDTL